MRLRSFPSIPPTKSSPLLSSRKASTVFFSGTNTPPNQHCQSIAALSRASHLPPKHLHGRHHRYATMSQSHACCTVPPVSHDYKEKGEWITADGLKTYATGDKSAKSALLVIYDIFGFFPQTFQGADILATGDKEKQYQVFMPDFFEGSPADISWYPPDTDEKGQKLGAFFSNQAAPPKTVGRIDKVLKEIQSQRPDIKEWGIVGFCWGGKIVNLVSQEGTPFKAAASCHPAMVDAGDAPGVKIPFAMLPSKDEPKEDVEKWQAAIKVKNIVQWWPNQIHGFMAARGDLSDPAVKSDYEKAYSLLLNFFHENM